MSIDAQLLRQIGNLAAKDRRSDALDQISRFLSVEGLFIFLPDPDTGELLTAPGFPQTLPQARQWRDFLHRCGQQGSAQGTLAAPKDGRLAPARGFASPDGSVLVLLGEGGKESLREELQATLPLLAAALKGERLSVLHASQTTFAEELARQSAALARSLDQSRRALQKELEERRRTETALHRAQQELQRHAETLEQHVAERTAKLTETIEELESFSYSIAHDMRAPLRAMEGYARFVLEERANELSEEAARALGRISASAMRLDRLIHDVLNYSRIVRGDFELGPINLERLVRDIIDVHHDWHSPKAEVIIRGKLPVVLGNEAFVSQCVTNLVANAIKFVRPGTRPQVDIFAERQNTTVRLCFKDNGIGVDAENQQRIFRIFERIHHPNEYEGTGIGLAIVRRAAERMGGKVSVESSPNQGSTFCLELKGIENG